MSTSGLVVLDKPAGLTSHDVVARVRRILGTRKVGHAGTLDPMATGILVVGVNGATRVLGHLSLRDKRYLATIRLGSSTVTDDREGHVLTTADPAVLAAVDDAAVLAGIGRLVGTLAQRPSSVSAVKVNGRRAYDRVRDGEGVTLAPRTVVVSRLDVVAMTRSVDAIDIEVDVECSTGTYVRALARDLGADLGVGGHLTSLRRTRVGPFEDAVDLDELEQRGAAALLPMADVARTCFPVWQVDDDEARAVGHGQRVPWRGPVEPDGTGHGAVAVIGPDRTFLALAVDDAGTARYLAVFGGPGPESHEADGQ